MLSDNTHKNDKTTSTDSTTASDKQVRSHIATWHKFCIEWYRRWHVNLPFPKQLTYVGMYVAQRKQLKATGSKKDVIKAMRSVLKRGIKATYPPKRVARSVKQLSERKKKLQAARRKMLASGAAVGGAFFGKIKKSKSKKVVKSKVKKRTAVKKFKTPKKISVHSPLAGKGKVKPVASAPKAEAKLPKAKAPTKPLPVAKAISAKPVARAGKASLPPGHQKPLHAKPKGIPKQAIKGLWKALSKTPAKSGSAAKASSLTTSTKGLWQAPPKVPAKSAGAKASSTAVSAPAAMS